MHNYQYLGIQGQHIFLILYSDSHPNCYLSKDFMTQLTAFFVTQPLPSSRRCDYLGGHDPPLDLPNSNGLIFLSASTQTHTCPFSLQKLEIPSSHILAQPPTPHSSPNSLLLKLRLRLMRTLDLNFSGTFLYSQQSWGRPGTLTNHPHHSHLSSSQI